MHYNYIIIEREYGSAGTEIGNLIGNKLGIPCYGSEILDEVAKRLSIPVSQIQQHEEKTTNSFLYSIYVMGKIQNSTGDYISREDRIFLEEQDVIADYALKGSSVFVGRCAANAIADREDVLKVFIHADRDFRKKNAIEKYGIDEKNVNSVLEKFDKKRSNYFYVNTKNKWSDPNNYHMILDSGKLGIEKCADIICDACK